MLLPILGFSQDDHTRFSEVEFKYGYGGLWTLNALDFIPQLGISIGHGVKQDDVGLSLRVGYERAEENHHVPLQIRMEKIWDRFRINLDMGYSWYINDVIAESSVATSEGGVAMGTHFSYRLLTMASTQCFISVGYDFRQSLIKFNQNDLNSEQLFHYAVIKARLVL